eukprot:10557743-Ditylum_brightwellii.AAC.1
MAVVPLQVLQQKISRHQQKINRLHHPKTRILLHSTRMRIIPPTCHHHQTPFPISFLSPAHQYYNVHYPLVCGSGILKGQ